MTEPNQNEKPSWFERPKNINLMIFALVAAGVSLLVIELIFGQSFHDEHHPPAFEIEEVFAYQAWIGFGAFVAVVALGSLLRLFIRQPEDFYDR